MIQNNTFFFTHLSPNLVSLYAKKPNLTLKSNPFHTVSSIIHIGNNILFIISSFKLLLNTFFSSIEYIIPEHPPEIVDYYDVIDSTEI